MITSKQNSHVKRVRALRDKKYRDEYGEYVAEGVKSVAEAIALGEKVSFIAATEKGAALLAAALETAGASYQSAEREIFSEDVFAYMSEESSPQGVLAVIGKPTANIDEIADKCVFLDGVSDPANVGAIIRSAAAFGYKTVIIADGADAFSGKAVRASMGGIFRVKVLAGGRAELLKKVKVPLVVADMCGQDVGKAYIPARHCLVIGNEAHGVSVGVRSLARSTVSVPMQNGMESLNAAVSAGIIMYTLLGRDL